MIITEVAVDWESLALLLDFDYNTIKIIREDNSGRNEKTERSCQDMLCRWLNGEACKPITWEKLIEAIRDIPRRKLASEIEQLLTA